MSRQCCQLGLAGEIIGLSTEFERLESTSTMCSCERVLTTGTRVARDVSMSTNDARPPSMPRPYLLKMGFAPTVFEHGAGSHTA